MRTTIKIEIYNGEHVVVFDEEVLKEDIDIVKDILLKAFDLEEAIRAYWTNRAELQEEAERQF